LNPAEIKVLRGFERIPFELEDICKWLLIGHSIGQRVSDLLSLNASNNKKANNGLYIDIIQQKTKKAVTIGVSDPLVIDLLESEFPKVLSQEAFNKQIKMITKTFTRSVLVSFSWFTKRSSRTFSSSISIFSLMESAFFCRSSFRFFSCFLCRL
jgi:hypothetical protein